jgi:hypothetical protein
MNSKQKIALSVLIATVVGIILYLLLKTRSQDRRIAELEDDNLRLQKILFEKYGHTPDIAIKEIDILIQQFQTTHPETVANLIRAKNLYLQGHGEEAVKKLVVILENKLKLKFESENDSWFTTLTERKKKFIKFDDLFKRAKEINLFNDLQLSIARTAVQIRNQESHQEAFQDERKRVHICFIGSLEIIGALFPPKVLTEPSATTHLLN